MRVFTVLLPMTLVGIHCTAQAPTTPIFRRSNASAIETIRVGRTEINLIPPEGMVPDIRNMPAEGGLAGFSLWYRDPNNPSATPKLVYWAHVYTAKVDQQRIYSALEQKNAVKELTIARTAAWQNMLQTEARKTEDSLRESDTLDAAVTMIKLDDAQSGENWYQFSMILGVQSNADSNTEALALCCSRMIFIKGKLLNLRAYTNFSTIKDHPTLRQIIRNWHQSLKAINN